MLEDLVHAGAGRALKKMSRIHTKQLLRSLGLTMMTAGLLLSSAHGDEIIFKNDKEAKIGTVLEMDEQSVTIRFPKGSITSIIMNRVGIPYHERGKRLKSAPSAGTQFEKRMEGIQDRVQRLEQKVEEEKGAGGSPSPGPSKKAAAHEMLLQEEMGAVKGVIAWQGKPLQEARVKIVLEEYTGFSLASVKRMFSRDKGRKKPSEGEIKLFAQTDSQGRYAFLKVPPGYYRIYWLPRDEGAWYHRLRDRPDFEVLSGQVTIQNIPEKK